MVSVKQSTRASGSRSTVSTSRDYVYVVAAMVGTIWLGWSFYFGTLDHAGDATLRGTGAGAGTTTSMQNLDASLMSPQKPHPIMLNANLLQEHEENQDSSLRDGQRTCSYRKLDQVPEHEVYPQAGERHMITPPSGGKLSLVCCDTTAGPLDIMVHHKWAPIGAARFMDMVTSGYFNSQVPLMRCVKNFLCQFGLNADKAHRKDFDASIEDDPNWLPKGAKHRQNEAGVKRFARGYMAYAGSGQNSRSNQLIVALKDNGPLAGGSPWEVPWGELVHQESFETLSKIYTGYGEDGPPQGQLMNKGMTAEMKEKWPELDYVTKCHLMDEREVEDRGVND
eukprot:Nitzschia sp. Nitz4//scaffold136_size62208//22497//23507//NITZ4_006365-RA/size62208-processed-gene-0.34-mRNA-1//-1//CDS//3329535609//954//frame0